MIRVFSDLPRLRHLSQECKTSSLKLLDTCQPTQVNLLKLLCNRFWQVTRMWALSSQGFLGKNTRQRISQLSLIAASCRMTPRCRSASPNWWWWTSSQISLRTPTSTRPSTSPPTTSRCSQRETMWVRGSSLVATSPPQWPPTTHRKCASQIPYSSIKPKRRQPAITSWALGLCLCLTNFLRRIRYSW